MYYGVMQRLDEMPKGAWIALMVIGFVVFWPVGLALLFYLKWSGRMSSWKNGGYGRWYTPDGRNARQEFRAWKRQAKWGRPSSGNVAFDEYREETLRKLDEEQHAFRDYLDKLRSAKDRAEFDQFMAERRTAPPSPTVPPAPMG